MVVGIIGFVILAFRTRRFDRLTGAFLAVSAASLLCIIWTVGYLGPVNDLENGRYEAVFEVDEIQYQMDGTAYFTAKLDSLNGEKFRFGCKLAADKLPYEISPGDKLSSVIEVIEFEDDEYSFDEHGYYRSMNIWINAIIEGGSDAQIISHTEYHLRNAVNKIRQYCVDSFRRYTGDESADFLTALTIGDKSELSDSVKRDMSRLGISHMIAISGMHLAIIMGCIIILIGLMGFDRFKGSVIVIVLCIAYIIISGANGSVLRSGIMFILMALSSFVRRDNDSLTSLFAAVSSIIILSPSSIFDIGLILSFTSTLGIIVVTGDYLKKLDNEGNAWYRFLNGFKVSVVTTLAAMTFSLLPMIIYFSTFSVISVFTNLIFTPVITVIMFGILVFIAFSPFPFIARMLGRFLDMAVSLFIYLAKHISRLPDISLSLEYPFLIFAVAAFAIGVVIAFMLKKRVLLLLSYILWLTVYMVGIGIYTMSYNGAADMLFLSEGGKDAMLIRSGSDTVYIDLGKSGYDFTNKAFAHLDKSMYSAELDHWIIARYSDDEIGVISDGIAAMRVYDLYIPYPADDYEAVIAEELEYYCRQEGTTLTYYKYDIPLLISDMSITLTEPIALEDTAVRLLCASVEVGDEKAVYYSSGYFEYSEEHIDADTVFMGSAGSRRTQRVSPELSCDRLIVSVGNDVASRNIKARLIYPFDSKNTFCKIRIG